MTIRTKRSYEQLRLFFILFFGITLALSGHAQGKANSQVKEIEKLLQELGPQWRSQITAKVALNPETEIFANQADVALIPASVTKVVTSLSVLKRFPPGTKVKTQLLVNDEIKDGVLQGPLYLKGGGDPGFVSESMWYLVNAFTRNGIKRIKGSVIVDETLFDGVAFDPSRQSVRVDRAYDAPVSAMSFNWNSINIFVRPGSQDGTTAQVDLDPVNDFTLLVNQVQTSGKTNLIVDRDPKGSRDQVVVKGSIARGAPEQVIYKNITRPALWSGHQLKAFLSQRGILVEGEILVQETPRQARVVAEFESKPIEHLLADMNKFSNNFVAEMLTKLLGSTVKKPASLEDGLQLLREDLKQLKIPKNQYVIENPSGLTRKNRLSAEALWSVLWHLKSRMLFEPEFLTSLPIAGVDGTLKRRMRNTEAERWVRAKTGYLDGVVSLAGYAGQENGDVLTFVLIYNGSKDEAKVRSVFDRIMEVLVKGSR